MVRSANLKFALMLSAAAVALPVAPAMAQQIEEIIVTAQKREQAAQDVPIALTAYSGEFLEELGLRELDELSDFVPGLQVQLQSPNNPGFVIRGITSDSGSSQQEARVSVFIDGVPASRARGAVAELFDIERVEVLKGPQGTLFGRGAQIGAVSIITRKPTTDDVEVSGRVGFGNYEARTFEGAVNVPLADNAAVRLAAIKRERDGYIENIGSDEALNGVSVTAFRGSFLIAGSDRFELTGVLNYQEDEYTGTSFKTGRFSPVGGDTSPYSAAQLNRGDELGVDRDTFNATLTASYDISDAVTLTSITGYREFNSFEEFDADGTQAFVLEFAEDAEGEQWSQEFRANFTWGDKFEGFVGASYFQEDGFQRVPFQTDERQLAALLFGQPIVLPNGQPNTTIPAIPVAPGVFLPLRPLATAEFTNFGDNTAYEVFADGTYFLTPALSLTAGLRFTYEELESSYVQSVDQTPSLTANVFANSPRRTLSDEFESVVGRVIATYQPTDDSLFYAGVSRGRRPAVVNVTANPATSGVLKNELVWSYEAGGKVGFADNRFLLEGATFYYDYSNFQTTVDIAEPPFQITDDAGAATAYGFELSVNAQATDWALLFATYSYIDASFDDEDSSGRPQQLAGNTFRLTPKHSASLGATFNLPVGDGLEAFFTPTYTYKSRVYFEESNLPGIEQEGYGLVNLRAGVGAADGSWTLTGYVTNALDEEYIIDAGNTGGIFGIPTFIAGAPRFYGVEASFRF